MALLVTMRFRYAISCLDNKADKNSVTTFANSISERLIKSAPKSDKADTAGK